jgi:hypothetical protein
MCLPIRCLETSVVYSPISQSLHSNSFICYNIKINRLSSTGHATSVENSVAVSKVFDTRPEGTRETGRPKLRCEDGVIQDVGQGSGGQETG